MEPEVYILLAVAGLALFVGLIALAMNLSFAKEKKYAKIQAILTAHIAAHKKIDEDEIRSICTREKVESII